MLQGDGKPPIAPRTSIQRMHLQHDGSWKPPSHHRKNITSPNASQTFLFLVTSIYLEQMTAFVTTNI